jgi:branched-chain amino acid transport system permease protein
MAGGYVGVLLVNRLGMPYLAALPLAALAAAMIGALLERTLYVHVYRKSHLDQVLFTIGLVFMSSAGVAWAAGSSQVFVALPDFLRARYEVLGISMGAYRLLVIVICAVLALGLHLLLTRTRFGSRLRAAVDDPVVARGLGIDVGRIFLVTFSLGSGLAGLGGALGAEILGLDPSFPLKFMVYFLVVVAVGGGTTLVGPFLAALLLGVADVAGKYYVPDLGAFVIYSVMLVVLLLRPEGLFAPAGRR